MTFMLLIKLVVEIEHLQDVVESKHGGVEDVGFSLNDTKVRLKRGNFVTPLKHFRRDESRAEPR